MRIEAVEDLPDFEQPPVIETVLAIHFREIPELSSARIGQFWAERLAQELPDASDRPPHSPPLERFGPGDQTVSMRLQLSSKPPVARSWFAGGNQLVQVQPNWFATNWRRTDAEPGYVHYPTTRERFERWFAEFATFVDSAVGKPIVPVQCEVTYVNEIPLSEEDRSVGPLGGTLKGAKPSAGEFLPVPERAAVSWTYRIDDERGLGRLHLSAQNANRDAVRLVLTARGRPTEESIPAALDFFDLGHEWIVMGFKDVTTDQMWRRWGIRSRS
jgi:uncharacterized protein (TIGR04255 family)